MKYRLYILLNILLASYTYALAQPKYHYPPSQSMYEPADKKTSTHKKTSNGFVVDGDTFVHSSIKHMSDYTCKLAPDIIKHRLIGKWKFIELQAMGGQKVDSVAKPIFSEEKIQWVKAKFDAPDFIFKPDMTFRIISSDTGARFTTGTWSYADTSFRDALILTFDSPTYTSREDSVWMAEDHLPLISRKAWFIRDISDKELYLINTLPTRKGQFGFNIEYFRKEE